MNESATIFDLAFRHHQAGNLQQAYALYRQILQVDPRHVDSWHLLGLVAAAQSRHDLACEYIGNALSLKPDFAEAHFNLGNELCALGRPNEAIASYRQALLLKPDYVEAHNNLGFAFKELDRLDEAAACFQTALQLAPTNFEAHCNLGLTLREQGKLAEAVTGLQNSQRLRPDHAGVRLWLGMLHLQLGDFVTGWQEYEWRKQVESLGFHELPEPLWEGEPFAGRTCLLRAEQGFGDTLQFIRYAPLVKKMGGTLLVECPAQLVQVVERCAGVDGVVTEGQPRPHFDVQASLLSLPGIFKTTLETVPAAVPYLSAPAELVEYWRREMTVACGSPLTGTMRNVGIVWQGSPKLAHPEHRRADRRRSIPLAWFEPLAHIPGVRLFSLQKGFGRDQLAGHKNIFDLGERLVDFLDTAAVMMNLDLIISADTAPLHLAGALGQPVWAVLPFSGCWRWLQDRPDSPWYPSMRSFRQTRPGNWGETFERVAGALHSFSPGS